MRADYIMIGGFLGAGKTTALLKLAAHLTSHGRRVGLITNDQSSGLVDTTLVTAQGYPVEEITGGCFCCRFNSLTTAAERLTASAKPDVFLAEPVGSCTDLRASVQYPLRRLYGEEYRIAPLSVLVDPIRALRILGIEGDKAFSPKVLYVYGKQLEEAEIIVINKSDLVTNERQSALRDALRAVSPHAEVFAVSARTGAGLDEWFSRIASADSDGRQAPGLDYELYADGEALLGWLNATLRLTASSPFDGNALALDLARAVGARLASRDIEIAHFKTTLTPDEGIGDLAAVNLVASDRAPESSHRLQEEMRAGELIVNLRAEGEPQILHDILMHDIVPALCRRMALAVSILHVEHFRPGKPSPTHRFATA
jgi:Ni2+-binding GTPase involved in maturation of urease and hydrogenase